MNGFSSEFKRAQVWGARILAVASGVMAVTVAVLGYLLPIGSALPGLTGLLFAAFAAFGARRADGFGRQLIGVGVTGQAIAFAMALSGTGWQIDGHFIFLVSMAALATLIDVWVIVTATAIIAVHHLGLGILLPQLVFPSLDWQVNVPRALFHAVMVILLDVGLILSILNRQKLDRLSQERLSDAEEQTRKAAAATAEADELRTAAEAQAAGAETAKKEAEKALQKLSETQAARDAADKQAVEAEAESRAAREAFMQQQSAVVTELQSALSRLAAGDMTQVIVSEFPEAYEGLRHDYNSTVANLGRILSDMSQKTWDLKGQVATIDSSASDVAKRTEHQVAELEQAINRIKALNESARQSAQSAEGTAKTAHDMHSKAEEGGEVVRKAVAAMGDIQASSQEIAKINAVIDGIAFQTNLLALNAGVEAARAGEAGRGFSVVASEVRALALRTTEAASDISRLVGQSESQVQTGFDLVSQTGKTLEGMISDISEMTGSVASIAEASRTQSEGFESVTESISGLDAVAQQNAAMFEETSAACSMLNDGMVEIVDQLGQFSVQSDAAIAAE